MKFLALALAALALAAPAWGADDVQATQATKAAAEAAARERERIRGTRATVQSTYAAEERACYGRFAVNDCLDKAKGRRNDALAELRRQELVLNDEERKRKAAERQREFDERNSPERLLEADLKRQQSVAEREAREAQNAEKAAERAADVAKRAANWSNGRRPPASAAAAPASAPRPAAAAASSAVRPAQGALPTQQPTAAEAARNRAEHEARVKDAQERKARILQENAQKKKPAASGLPPPPT